VEIAFLQLLGASWNLANIQTSSTAHKDREQKRGQTNSSKISTNKREDLLPTLLSSFQKECRMNLRGLVIIEKPG
jgi:hypothetical protein